MSEVVINVTKVDEVVTINVTPNVTQILVNTNSGGGGAVDSVNGQTGIVVLDTDDISDSSTTNKFVTSAEKTAITHSNRSVLDAITESFTTALKTAYDNAVNWITTNGTNVLNHIASTSNPHNVTKSQVGLSNVPNTDTTTTANITDSTNKRFVTDANLVVIGNTSGTNTGDNATNTTSNAYADAKVEDAIVNGVTTKAPSQNAVFDAFNNLDPLVKRRYFDDLQGYGTGGVGSIFNSLGTLEFEGNILLNKVGTNAVWTRTTAESGRSGIIRGGTGSTSTGLALLQFRSIWLGTENFESETSVRIQTLSDATNRFTLTFVNGVGTTNSIRFFYSDNVNGGRWQCETYSSSVSTLVDSGVSVAINTWYVLKVVRISMICYFYINGTLVATISTNIPSNFESFCTMGITKTAGTTSRTCDFDYLKFFDL